MAQGTIRIRCKVCRKEGIKDGYSIQKAKDVRCKHPVSFQGIFPIPGTSKQDVATYEPHNEPNKPTAFEQAGLFLAEKKLFYNKNPQYEKPEQKTFAIIADEYLEEKKKSPKVGPKTWSNYDSIVRIHLKPQLGKFIISDITPKMAENVRISVQSKSKSIQQKVNMRMNAIFRRAARENLITELPTKDLDKLDSDQEIIYNILEPQQIRDFLNIPIKSFFKLYYKLPIYCGLRASEVAGLGWDCIHFETREVEVKRVLVWLSKKEMKRMGIKVPWYFKPCPKTQAGFRKIPLNDELIKEFQIFKIEQPENAFNLVFTTATGKPINHNALEQGPFKEDAKKAGISKIKYHELRHTFCSLAFAAGVDSALVQYYMGHKKPDMTAGIYRHLLEEQRRKGSGFAQKMANIITPKPSCVTAVSL